MYQFYQNLSKIIYRNLGSFKQVDYYRAASKFRGKIILDNRKVCLFEDRDISL